MVQLACATLSATNTPVQTVQSGKQNSYMYKAIVFFNKENCLNSSVPSVFSSPLCDTYSKQYVGYHSEKDYEPKPAIKGNNKKDNSHSNVHQGGCNVKQNVR